MDQFLDIPLLLFWSLCRPRVALSSRCACLMVWSAQLHTVMTWQ